MTAILLTVLGACTLAPYIVFRIQKRLVPGIFFKIATSIFFLLTACAAAMAWPAETFEQYKHLFFFILIGQIFGLLGDYWMDMKDMMPKDHDAYAFAGFASFCICHLFFIAGLYRTYAAYGSGIGWKYQLIVPAAGLVLAAFVLVTEKPMKVRYGKFKGIATTYSVIFGMSIAMALCCWLFGDNNPQALVMTIGLVIFLLSDLVLSGTIFGEGKDRPIDYALNYLFYYGGQFIIALSLLWIGWRVAPGA